MAASALPALEPKAGWGQTWGRQHNLQTGLISEFLLAIYVT
jgi:hypothetical protein